SDHEPAFRSKRQPLEPVVMKEIEQRGRVDFRAGSVGAAAKARPGCAELIKKLLRRRAELTPCTDNHNAILEESRRHSAILHDRAVVAEALDELSGTVVIYPAAFPALFLVFRQARAERLRKPPGR